MLPANPAHVRRAWGEVDAPINGRCIIFGGSGISEMVLVNSRCLAVADEAVDIVSA